MAADWQPECLVPQNQPSLDVVGAHSERALQNTSGNVQSYSDGLVHNDAGREDHLQQLAFKYPHHPVASHQVSAPGIHHPALAARLQAKKLRRLNSVGPNVAPRRGRSYLKSQKYLEYRARPRRDTGKDGEPVWSDGLEDAFQQGMYLMFSPQNQGNFHHTNNLGYSPRSESSNGPEKVVRARKIIRTK